MLPAAPLHARSIAERTVEAPYLAPAVGVSVYVGGQTTAYYYDCLEQIGCAIVPLQKGDRYATLEVVDTTGRPVLGSVYVTPGFGHVGYICGGTDDPIPVRGLKEIVVHVISGMCPDGSPSLATHGVVRATITARPRR
jgi:hypothetical protein